MAGDARPLGGFALETRYQVFKDKIWNIDRAGFVHRQPITLAQFRAAQHRVQRIAFGAGAAGFLLGVVVSLIVMFVQIGVR